MNDQLEVSDEEEEEPDQERVVLVRFQDRVMLIPETGGQDDSDPGSAAG